MDVIGLAASIIAVIDAISTTVTCLNAVKNAPKERSRLAVEAADLSARLTRLRYKHEASDGDVSTSAEPWLDGIQSLKTPLDQFRATVESLTARLTERSGPGKLVSCLIWPLDKKSTLEYLAQIERMKTLTILALQEDVR